MYLILLIGGFWEREAETDRQTERETETDRDRDRETETERDRENHSVQKA